MGNVIRSHRRLLAAALVVVCAAAVGCGSTGSRIALSDAVAPVPPEQSSSAAVYMRIKNSGGQDDRLLSITSSQSPSVMLHRTSIDRAGTATMKMVNSLAVPAGTTVTLRPGGLHLMMMSRQDLMPGTRFTLHLRFEHAGYVDVNVRVIEDSSEVPE